MAQNLKHYFWNFPFNFLPRIRNTIKHCTTVTCVLHWAWRALSVGMWAKSVLRQPPSIGKQCTWGLAHAQEGVAVPGDDTTTWNTSALTHLSFLMAFSVLASWLGWLWVLIPLYLLTQGKGNILRCLFQSRLKATGQWNSFSLCWWPANFNWHFVMDRWVWGCSLGTWSFNSLLPLIYLK